MLARMRGAGRTENKMRGMTGGSIAGEWVCVPAHANRGTRGAAQSQREPLHLKWERE